jgi:hypothetical protein
MNCLLPLIDFIYCNLKGWHKYRVFVLQTGIIMEAYMNMETKIIMEDEHGSRRASS